jgi:type IV pilus assembly protein PilE
MQHPSIPRRRSSGFTLIEVLSVLGIASILSSIAYPSFQGGLHKARRADALVALVQVQISQERWIANHRSYADLAALRLPARSNGGHYTIEVLAADEGRYEAIARATGTQARDSECRHMKLVIEGAVATRASGADDSVANPPAANRRCWGL